MQTMRVFAMDTGRGPAPAHGSRVTDDYRQQLARFNPSLNLHEVKNAVYGESL